ncbi:family 43 glycosylhydrolase [Paenibacillus nasutitermitis]|uniref:Glycosyl hydrolase family 32 N-terminal domain-containing protein n=1 Tax=Paenibacillus nasutitermitis TaxID=1652958 RepID=A0A916YLF2_9BACL|nr:family 43 glycosylhydrolase [Paenibacillus nasutitermitis]GGD51138.1 hypothetical protein GCM10010911_05850 [Paenibacillus nasutitermitis]
MSISEEKDLLVEIARQQRELARLIKSRFEHVRDPLLRDWMRGLSYINKLHAKTLDFEAGLIPVNHEEYTSQESRVQQSKVWLAHLFANENIWNGRFAEIDGLCVDHAFFKVDGVYHLIYIRLEACSMWQELPMSNFGHAVSRDLIHWDVLEPVLPTRPGTWENTHVWAPHVITFQEKYWMFYTGVNENACQAVNAACSTDLSRWERVSEEPLIRPGSWGHWNPAEFSNCRDPFVLQTTEGFFCYYTGFLKDEQQYCVGISRSNDLIRWEDCGYVVLAGSKSTPPESPFVVERSGQYYMFYTSYADGTVVAVSDRPDGGFADCPEETYILRKGVSASEFLQDDDGQWLMTAISHDPNHFHFIEFFRMYWPDDGNPAFRLEPIKAAEYDFFTALKDALTIKR